MSTLPGVSIVIPNYNYERFLAAAVESALAQDHPMTETIVVDDGSRDGSRAVLASFGDRIRTVCQPNQGHVAACTRGWQRARHDIIIFLDSDDMLVPDAASSVARAWRPGISKMQWCFAVIDVDGRPLGHVFPKYPSQLEPETVRRELLRVGSYPCARTSGNAYARSFLEAFGAFEGGDWMDGRLNPAAPLYGDVVTVQRTLSLYRVHGTNDSAYGRLNMEQLERQIELIRWHRQYVARCCARVGVPFDAARALRRDLWYHQHRLVLAKLRSPAGEGTVPAWKILGEMLAATLASTEPLWQRFAVAAWATLVAATPHKWCRTLIVLRYEPTNRPQWLQRLAEGIGRSRRTRGAGRTTVETASEA